MSYASAIAVIIVALALMVVDVIAVFVFRNPKRDDPPAIIERTGVYVLSTFRSELNQYAKEIHNHVKDQDVDPDIIEAQEATCQEIMMELDRAILEAYETPAERDLNFWDGMSVKDLMFALSDSVLSDKITMSSSGLIRSVRKDEDDNIILVGLENKNDE